VYSSQVAVTPLQQQQPGYKRCCSQACARSWAGQLKATDTLELQRPRAAGICSCTHAILSSSFFFSQENLQLCMLRRAWCLTHNSKHRAVTCSHQGAPSTITTPSTPVVTHTAAAAAAWSQLGRREVSDRDATIREHESHERLHRCCCCAAGAWWCKRVHTVQTAGQRKPRLCVQQCAGHFSTSMILTNASAATATAAAAAATRAHEQCVRCPWRPQCRHNCAVPDRHRRCQQRRLAGSKSIGICNSLRMRWSRWQ
jgi:hypothetical protein